ncbi:MAG: 6,7-dimethyl-8-ribityllumazine synthase [SAR324 cluster bacterium]|nr:6,7-dimethyl-8-ribityllumazine synthase [SAR324 cluster bacterium]MCZ6532563.1 6,7-dimethyl-8-ribityllumazine synthase [SAR324 cluster bacterium]MCZ6557670.1 6,7-dimethyl-8-ribityllumazine synthase [SAR324 cluster bacterium]MCZ6626702.1 6,7-dimethyl-8-ribityllumazine synthase [SAR324 cluster bacterium]MCZ6646635.1 6,7-dimethyl-8-ribityllumazine synthase [SAR324 cluster bacterium]
MGKIEGNMSASGLKLAVVVSRFNSFITDRLLEGVLNTYTRQGGSLEDVDVVHVPGAFEIPMAAKRLATRGGYDAMVALAAIVRGATPHFDYVSSATTSGVSSVALEFGIPIGFGVLTTDTVEQAIERAGLKSGNKGSEAVMTAIEMANLMKALGE